MADWQTMNTAHRNSVIWLFLPGTIYNHDEDGRPKGPPKNEVVLAVWDNTQMSWVLESNSSRKLYPSLWAPQTVDGKPEEPVLEAQAQAQAQ